MPEMACMEAVGYCTVYNIRPEVAPAALGLDPGRGIVHNTVPALLASRAGWGTILSTISGPPPWVRYYTAYSIMN
jgi:hypothetical protein